MTCANIIKKKVAFKIVRDANYTSTIFLWFYDKAVGGGGRTCLHSSTYTCGSTKIEIVLHWTIKFVLGCIIYLNPIAP